MIKIVDLTKNFGELEVLKGVNFEIAKGEKIVVIGASGSGKSTLLRCLNMLEVPTSGEIFLDDEQVDVKNINVIRQKWVWFFKISIYFLI